MGGTKAVASLIVLLALSGCARTGGKTIRVGSKNFTEQVILGEIIAQHVEGRLHIPVQRSLNLGGTLLAHQALRSGEIDLYPEYTGTALAAILKQSAGGAPAEVLGRVRAAYLRDFQIEWLDPFGINNSFAMVIRGADARTRHLETLSEAARVSEPWALGVGYEFEQRADGLPSLDKTYGFRWNGRPRTMDLGLLYKALEQEQVTMIAANSTDGVLSKLDLKILQDDKHAFPPYEVAIAVRQDSMARVPGLREALQELSGKFSNAGMQTMNYKVDGEHRSVAEVAAEFLKSAGLQ
jgi:glycine betaine/choline ABC-type transport system substrate-binding protein